MKIMKGKEAISLLKRGEVLYNAKYHAIFKMYNGNLEIAWFGHNWQKALIDENDILADDNDIDYEETTIWSLASKAQMSWPPPAYIDPWVKDKNYKPLNRK